MHLASASRTPQVILFARPIVSLAAAESRLLILQNIDIAFY